MAVDTTARIRAIRPGPVKLSCAAAAVIPRGRLRSAVASGELTVIRRGFVVPTTDWQAADAPTRRSWALWIATTAWAGSFGSHDTAALQWRMPDYRVDVAGDPPITHITCEGRARTEGWLRVHGCDTTPEAATVLDGLPVTSLVRTAIDMCATRSFRSSLVFMDAAMRRAVEIEHGTAHLRSTVIDPAVRARVASRFDGAVAPYSRHRWVTHVRRAIRHADPAAETVLESLSRVAMIEHSIPLPRCGVPLTGDDGRTYWVDFYWDDLMLIGEADGAVKYVEPDVLVAEKRRQEALEARGYRFVRWGMPEVTPSSDVVAARIRREMARHSPRRAWDGR